MGCTSSSLSQQQGSGQEKPDYSQTACVKTKCGGQIVDSKKASQALVFPTVQQIPLAYLKEKYVITCQVVNVPDGDTVRCKHLPGGAVRRDPLQKLPPWVKRLKPETLLIRLYGVDAPERAKFRQAGQPFAEEARNLVIEKLLDRVVYVKLLSVDQYGRALCRILYVTLADYNNYYSHHHHHHPNHSSSVRTPVRSRDDVPSTRATAPSSMPGSARYPPTCRVFDSKGTTLPHSRTCWCLCSRSRAYKHSVVEKDICDDLLLNGLAVVYRGHGGEYDGRYADLVAMENIAKQNLRGLWSLEQPQLPADFKRQQQQQQQQNRRQALT